MKGIVIQLLSSTIISLGNFLTGFSIVWPSYTLAVLQSDKSPIGRVTSTEATLIGSLPMLGVLTTIVIGSVLSDNFGRKKTEILCGLCFVLSWSIIKTASNVTTLLAGRLMIGVSTGMHAVVAMPLLSEISQPSIRGTAASLTAFASVSGTLTSYLIGWFCSYDVICYFNLALSVVFVMLLCFLKETPAWLLGQRREKDAIISLKFYRGVLETTQDVMKEIESLKNLRNTETVKVTRKTDVVLGKPDSEVEKESLNQEEVTETEMGVWKTLYTSKAARRALLTTTIHVILLVFAGTMAVQTYAAQLFTAAAPNMSAHACSVLLAIAFLLGCVLALVLSDLIGRRPLMITSSILSSCCLTMLASLLRWSWGPEWMAPAAVLVFACIFQMGLGNVPYIQLAESFIPKVKGITVTIVLIFEAISNFTVLAMFPMAVETIGLDGAFLVFAAVCAVTALFAALFMQETKGAPIEDILRMHERGYLYRRHDK